MENFVFENATKIYFGKGELKQLDSMLAPFGKKVLLVYGGGSIKRTGLYQKITEILLSKKYVIYELAGVEPNPRVTTVNKGAEICKEQGVEIILAIGGGSSIDCAKVVAAAAKYSGDAWDLVKDSAKITEALPITTVLTLAATGSEMDDIAVINNQDTNEKIGCAAKAMQPKASILDPTLTYSVPKIQTAAGTADIFSHLMELYFKKAPGTYMQRRLIEGLMKTCIYYGPVACQQPNNYEARANLMWASSWAINGFLKSGNSGPWSLHPIEHQLSAFYDVTHGIGLAIITPPWLKKILNENSLEVFVEYGTNVWGLNSDLPPFEIATEAIKKTEEFYQRLGIPKTLAEIGVSENIHFKVMAERAVASSIQYASFSLAVSEVMEILEEAMGS